MTKAEAAEAIVLAKTDKKMTWEEVAGERFCMER